MKNIVYDAYPEPTIQESGEAIVRFAKSSARKRCIIIFAFALNNTGEVLAASSSFGREHLFGAETRKRGSLLQNDEEIRFLQFSMRATYPVLRDFSQLLQLRRIPAN